MPSTSLADNAQSAGFEEGRGATGKSTTNYLNMPCSIGTEEEKRQTPKKKIRIKLTRGRV